MDIKSEQLERVDRQTRVLGLEATKALSKGKCLIFNCGGLGVEIAKSVILMGMGEVHIIDENKASEFDQSSQFFLGEEELDGTRASISVEKLSKLNKYCIVKEIRDEDGDAYVDQKLLSSYDVVVITDENLLDDKIEKCNEICRKNQVKFIYATTLGVFASVFNDFGDEFTVKDVNGEKPNEGVIINLEIDEEGNGIIDVHDEENENVLHLYSGDKVKLVGIKGMECLNGTTRSITRTDMWKFSIGNVSDCGEYLGGGYYEEVKQPKQINFCSLKDFLKAPTSSMDYGKFGSTPKVIHAIHRVLHYQKMKGSLPRPWNEDDALECCSSKFDIQVGEFDETIVKQLAYTCRGKLNPMVTFIGGIVGQEIQKSITGKFHPIHNSFYYEATECLPKSKPKNYNEATIKGRYQSQAIIFGQDFQKILADKSYFMIGAGALGCELLKNFAMMGVGCGGSGKIVVTDMDSIEVSNLSRQFLFREEHVSQMKSICAVKAAKEMNPNIHCEARIDRLGAETQNIYNNEFWRSLNGAITALDNVPTRKYVDEKCVFYNLPMIDSGTLGTKAHVQVVDPLAKTECYRSKKEQPVQEFAFCTVHVNPNIIEHTITWAKNQFVGKFNQNIQQANKYLENPSRYLKSEDGNNLISLESVYYGLIKNKPSTFKDCINWARQTYQDLFDYGIRNLLLTYPEDKKTKSGALFWSGSKRCPHPVPYDEADEMTIMFIESASRHYATLYNIPIEEQIDFMLEASQTSLEEYVPQAVEDEEKKKEEEEEEEDLSEEEQEKRQEIEQNELSQDMRWIAEMREVLSKTEHVSDCQPLNLIEFEKDDPTNYHVEFITSASNLRARAYGIPEADLQKTKGIAGNIIPAMITTTALTTGLVCLELYKIIQGASIEELKDSSINIALPHILQWEPKPAQNTIAGKYTIWDKFIVHVENDITFSQLLDHLKSTEKLDVMAITYSGCIVYNEIMMEDDKKEKLLQTNVKAFISALTKKYESLPTLSSPIRLDIHGSEVGSMEIFDGLPPVLFSVEKSKKAKKLLSTKEQRLALAKKKAEAKKKALALKKAAAAKKKE